MKYIYIYTVKSHWEVCTDQVCKGKYLLRCKILLLPTKTIAFSSALNEGAVAQLVRAPV